MTEAHLTSVVNGLWVILMGVLGWIGVRIFNKLDKLSEQMAAVSDGLQKQISDGDNILHGRITELGERVTRVETRCQIEHKGAGQ